MHHYVAHVYNKTYSKEIHPGETPFSRTKGFSIFSCKHLVFVQTSTAEELPETAVKTWKRPFLTELRTCQPLLIFFLFTRATI